MRPTNIALTQSSQDKLNTLENSQCVNTPCELLFNTSSLALTGAITATGYLDTLPDGTEVAVYVRERSERTKFQRGNARAKRAYLFDELNLYSLTCTLSPVFAHLFSLTCTRSTCTSPHPSAY